jgi:dolichol-phosphate mannosyltransferase
MQEDITTVVIIPSYNETLALPQLLRDLKPGLSTNDALIVMDDSPKEVSALIYQRCQEVVGDSDFQFMFQTSDGKSGRGAAIRRGMVIALAEFPNAKKFIECDADGSHRPMDIMNIKTSSSDADLLVGSRYLSASKIEGWPVSRRVFSWLLNRIIPKIMQIELHDITNGLRRYSRAATEKIVSQPQLNSGFIYLSEQAIYINRAGMKIDEVPTVFINRTLGMSTVTWREIDSSLRGILKLIGNNVRK